MISLQAMIPNLEQQLPPLRLKEMHCFVVQNAAWSDFLLGHLGQQPTLLLAPHHFIERMLQRQPMLRDMPTLSCAEWVHRRRVRLAKLIKSIAKQAINHQVIVIQVDCHKAELIEETLRTVGFLQQLKEWTVAENKLVLFSLYSELDNPAIQPLLQGSSSLFTSLHFVNQSYPNWHWTVQYWFDGYRVEQASIHLLEQQTTEGNTIFSYAEQKSERLDNTTNLMGDKAPRFYQQEVLAAGESIPAKWQVIELPTDVATLQLRGSDAVFLLSLKQRDNLFALAETVFKLRKVCGKYLRIIIRVRDTFLRFEDKRLLVMAGANLVAPAEMNIRQVINFAELTIGFSYNINQSEQFSTLQRQYHIDDVRGYLHAELFLKHVMAIEHKAESRSVETVLIKAQVAAGITPQILISRFGNRRSGDIISFIGEHLYIYLYSIRTDDLDQILFMRFGLPVQNLFKDELRITEHSQILDICDALAEQESRTPSIDFSAELQTLQERQVSKPVIAVPDAVRKATFI